MKDKLGNELEVGCVVDLLVQRMVSAYVIQIKEGGLVEGTRGAPQPAELIVQAVFPIAIIPGHPAPVYFVRAADGAEKEKIENSSERVM